MQARRGLLAGSWGTWGRVSGACVPVRGVIAGLRNGDSGWLGRDGRRGIAKYRQYPFEVEANQKTTQGDIITTNVYVTNNCGSKYIMLNRTEANNALTEGMIDDITKTYSQVPCSLEAPSLRFHADAHSGEGCPGLRAFS